MSDGWQWVALIGAAMFVGFGVAAMNVALLLDLVSNVIHGFP